MKILNDPKYNLLLCRVLPIACIILFVVLFFIPVEEKNNELVNEILLIDSVIYASFIMFYLPMLLFEGEYRFKAYWSLRMGISDPWWYLPFATLTFGFGPIYWYWLKVDPVLKKMINENI